LPDGQNAYVIAYLFVFQLQHEEAAQSSATDVFSPESVDLSPNSLAPATGVSSPPASYVEFLSLTRAELYDLAQHRQISNYFLEQE
jgi:hypothetical protein